MSVAPVLCKTAEAPGSAGATGFCSAAPFSHPKHFKCGFAVPHHPMDFLQAWNRCGTGYGTKEVFLEVGCSKHRSHGFVLQGRPLRPAWLIGSTIKYDRYWLATGCVLRGTTWYRHVWITPLRGDESEGACEAMGPNPDQRVPPLKSHLHVHVLSTSI